jgi:hypothetical protein
MTDIDDRSKQTGAMHRVVPLVSIFTCVSNKGHPGLIHAPLEQ